MYLFSVFLSLALPLLVASVSPRGVYPNGTYNSGQFTLSTWSFNPFIHNRTIIESPSTGNGSASLMLAPAGSTEMPISGYLADPTGHQNEDPYNTTFYINQPSRNQDNGKDAVVVPDVSWNRTAVFGNGNSAPQITPGRSSVGWDMYNNTDNYGNSWTYLRFTWGARTDDGPRGHHATFWACNVTSTCNKTLSSTTYHCPPNASTVEQQLVFSYGDGQGGPKGCSPLDLIAHFSSSPSK